MLHGGRWNGRQIVSEEWVTEATTSHMRTNRGQDYGYAWWVHDMQGYETCFAWGFGGQYIFVVPPLDLVMVTTSSPDVGEERRGHRRTLLEMLNELVVAPVADKSASSKSP